MNHIWRTENALAVSNEKYQEDEEAPLLDYGQESRSPQGISESISASIANANEVKRTQGINSTITSGLWTSFHGSFLAMWTSIFFSFILFSYSNFMSVINLLLYVSNLLLELQYLVKQELHFIVLHTYKFLLLTVS